MSIQNYSLLSVDVLLCGRQTNTQLSPIGLCSSEYL